MRRAAFVAGLTISVAAAIGAIAACGASDAASTDNTSGSSGNADAGVSDSSPFGDAGASVPLSANGIVLVHAARFPAFRICFDGTAAEQPIPATDLMPASNLPGIDVGTALRLAPRKGPLGRAHVFREATIRSLYFNSPQAGPSCENLLKSASGIESFQVATDLPDLSAGVHVLALRGCANDTIDPTASVARCGDDWTPTNGNLSLANIPVDAFTRPSMSGIPVQLVQLSSDLHAKAQAQMLGLAFGPLEAGAPTPFIEGVVPLETAVPDPPAVIDTRGIELGDFATNGLFVTLGAPLDDAGKPIPDAGDAGREVLLTQSLADIQRRSSSRSLPPDWFSTASSYVILSIGEIDPKSSDGGPGDERRALHLLAVPLAASADSGAPVIPDASTTD